VQEIVRPLIGNELALNDVVNELVDSRDMLRSQPREKQYRLLERLNAIVEQHKGRLLDSQAELIESIWKLSDYGNTTYEKIDIKRYGVPRSKPHETIRNRRIE